MAGYQPVNLAYLDFHWGSCYKISHRGGRYLAARKDDGRVLAADTADALLDVIRDDYARRPVPR